MSDVLPVGARLSRATLRASLAVHALEAAADDLVTAGRRGVQVTDAPMRVEHMATHVEGLVRELGALEASANGSRG